MIDFGASAFFNLDNFAHRGLFADGEPVWTALGARLAAYLEAWTDWTIASELPAGVHLLGEKISIAPGCSVEPGAVIV
ncbi:MAG: hypothetical protein E4H44_04405, partial [Candidatus Aminicenantes bacterium]